MQKTLNIIGCGNVGRVLGRLWHDQGILRIQDVLNRTSESAQDAVAFIGAGRPLGDPADLHAADIYLLGTPDDQIEEICERLASSGSFRPGSIVFHCSGALPSSALAYAARLGAAIASVHPIRSFANPEQVALNFDGTYCGAEGDSSALDTLQAAFSAIGARTVPINVDFKSIYHAAAVFASNYLVTLLDTAVAAYEKAGIPREDALRLVEPLVRGTVDNVFQLGPTNALSGPIARGDVTTVVRQYRAVRVWDRRRGALYKLLGKLTLDVARKRN